MRARFEKWEGLGNDFVVLRDPGKALDDATVRSLADHALWTIWLRADTPENNATLERVRDLIAHRLLVQAIELATRLVERAPGFAEAYNQRAIVYFRLGDMARAIEDCEKVLRLNPYHFGAASGLAQCFMKQKRLRAALRFYRRANRINPHLDGVKQVIDSLERMLGEKG